MLLSDLISRPYDRMDLAFCLLMSDMQNRIEEARVLCPYDVDKLAVGMSDSADVNQHMSGVNLSDGVAELSR